MVIRNHGGAVADWSGLQRADSYSEAAQLPDRRSGDAKSGGRDFRGGPAMTDRSVEAASARGKLLGTISWFWVGAPFAYGLCELLVKIPALFAS
jgi:hypothetical protein